MPEQQTIERLDRAIDALLAGRREALADRELAELLEIADALRDLPDRDFKAGLKWKIVPWTRHTITPHFRVAGVARMIDFLEQALGGVEEFRALRPDGLIAHAQVRVGDSTVEMGDAAGDYKPYAFGVHMYVDDVDAMYERALNAGATSIHAPVDQFYGERSGSIMDPFGNHWYLARRIDPRQPIPEGFRTITPFLLPRSADGMLDFLEQAFGGENFGEPYRGADGKIMHAAMRIGDSLIEMGEAHGEWQPMEAGIHLYVDDADAVYRQAAKAGATTVYPPTDTPYGERSAYVIDPFGNHWYIGTPK